MQAKDIEIGGEYAWGTYGAISRVRVVQKGIKSRSYSSRKDGVRIEPVTVLGRNPPSVVATRDLSPWNEIHDVKAARIAAQIMFECEVERLSDALGIILLPDSTTRVRIEFNDLVALAKRAGVSVEAPA